jgi:hypothetical protein
MDIWTLVLASPCLMAAAAAVTHPAVADTSRRAMVVDRVAVTTRTAFFA